MLPILVFLFLQLTLASAVSCPAGGTYDSNFQKCYIYNSQPAVFLEAESTCRSIGGNLAEIKNGFENSAVTGMRPIKRVYEVISEFVNSMTNGVPPPTYWIGANLLLSPIWTWTTDAITQYTNWAPEEPTDPSSFECGSVRTSGSYLWKKELCYSAHPFVCTVAPIPDPSDSPCDPGYFQYGDQCFKLFTRFPIPLNYYDSAAFCRLQGNATLPKITSQGMQEFVSSMSFNVKEDIWIGLTCWDKHQIDCWWWDGTQPTYSYWLSGHPVGEYPIRILYGSGLWGSEKDYRPITRSVVCQKAARK